MPILRGLGAGKVLQPRVVVSPTGQYTIYCTIGYKPLQTLYVQSSGAAAVAVSRPASLSITPTAFAFTTQSQTQSFTATVKDQFGSIMTGQPVVWSSNAAGIAINSGTGVATAVALGTTATITATVQNTSVTGTATATTPAQVGTTLTATAGYATLEAAAAAGGQVIGFSVNDSYESHSNYAQNYTQTAGAAGMLAVSEKFHNHWIASVTSVSSVNANLSEFYAEWARAQGQGSRIKIPYLIDEGIDGSGGIYPGITTYVTNRASAYQMMSVFAAAITSFWNPQVAASAYNSGATYNFGNVASESGQNYVAVANGIRNFDPSLNYVGSSLQWYWMPIPTATINAWNSGAAYTVGQYATNGGGTYFCWTPNTNQAPPNTNYWIKVGAGAVDTYSIVNECLNGGGAQGFFSAKSGDPPTTWVPQMLNFVYAGDPGARKYEVNNGHGERTGDAAQRTAVANLWSTIAVASFVPTAKLNVGYEGHVICSAMQSSGGSFDQTNFIAWLNAFSTAGLSWSVTEFDVTDDMLQSQNTQAAFTQRQQLVGLAYTNFFTALATATAKPDHVVFWQLRCPESWLQAAFPRADGFAQYPNIYLDYNAAQAPAFAAVVSWLTSGLGSVGSIVLNDNQLHAIPVVLLDQWGGVMPASALTWTSTDSTNLPVTSAGQVQALAGGHSATVTATYVPTNLAASVAVTSAAAALTALDVLPNPATMAAGTLQLTASEVDQYGNVWGGGGGAGGVWAFTSSGKGVAVGAVSAVTSASNTLWMKMRLLVDPIRALGTWTGAALVSIDSDGAGTNMKFNAAIGTNGSGQFALTCHGWGSGGGAGLGGPTTPYVNLSALPASGASNYILVYVGWNQTALRYYCAVADANGNIINDGANSASITQAANYGALATTGGLVTVNKNTQTSGPGQPQKALTWDGLAIYTNAPPAISSGLTSTCFAKPTTGDSGLAALWLMGDATSGTITTGAASFGGENMTLTNCTGASGDSGSWSGGSAPSLAWSSDNTAAATVNSSGLVTAVAPGVADVQAVLTAAPTITGTSVVTVQTTPAPMTLTVAPASVTLANGQTVQLLPNVLDQFGQPFSGATITYSSSNTSVATVGATSGIVTAAASSGSCTITTTVTSVTPNLTATTSVTDTTTSSTHPNEPAGMTPQINTGPLTGVPVSGATIGSTSSVFSMTSPSNPTSTGEWSGNLTATPSPDTGLRVVYPPSLNPGGASPVRFGFSFPDTTKTTLYIYFKIRYSANWTNNGNVGTKIVKTFLNPSNPGGENHFLSGRCDDPPNTDQFLQVFLQGPSGQSRNIPQPSGSQTWAQADPAGQLAGSTRGAWHTVEALYTPQSSVTGSSATSDGTATLWVDGAQSATASNCLFVGPGDSQAWHNLFFDPTYGGGLNPPPNVTPNLYWDFDALYVSSK